MPHGRRIYAKAYYMEKSTMCAYSQSDHVLPHWKCVLQFCAKPPIINLPYQETDDQYPDTSPSTRFHIYHMIASCTKHVRLPLTNKTICRKCHAIKELVMMETTISNFHTSFYIPEIQKLEFHIPHVPILGTNHCGEYYQNAFKRRKSFQNVLC